MKVNQFKRKLFMGIVVSAALAMTSFTAQAQYENPGDGVYKDRIDWGVMMDMSGPTSASQGIWVNGFQDYMRKINDTGGVGGRKINVKEAEERPRSNDRPRSNFGGGGRREGGFKPRFNRDNDGGGYDRGNRY